MKNTFAEWFLWLLAALFSVAVFLCAGMVYAETMIYRHSGSGGDAGTLDGLDSTAFSLFGHNHTGTYQPLNANLTLLGAMAPAGMTDYIVGVGVGGIYELKNSLAGVHTINLPAGDDYLVAGSPLGLDHIAEGSTYQRVATADVDASGHIQPVIVGTFAAPITTNPYSLASATNAILWYGATGEIDLPAAVAGMNVVIYNTGAFTITVDPNSNDVIVRDGNIQAGGLTFTLSSGAGNYVTLVSDAVNHWVTLGYKGVLGAGS